MCLKILCFLYLVTAVIKLLIVTIKFKYKLIEINYSITQMNGRHFYAALWINENICFFKSLSVFSSLSLEFF